MFLLMATGLSILIISWVAWSMWDRAPLAANQGEDILAAAMYGRHADINNDCARRLPNCVIDGTAIQTNNESRFGANRLSRRARMVTFVTDDGSRLVTAGLVDDPARPASDGTAGTSAMSTARIAAHLAQLRQSNAPDAPWRTGIFDGTSVVFSDRDAFPTSVPASQPISANAAGFVLPVGTPMIVSPMARRLGG